MYTEINGHYLLTSELTNAARKLLESGEALTLHNARRHSYDLQIALPGWAEDKVGTLVLIEAERLKAADDMAMRKAS